MHLLITTCVPVFPIIPPELMTASQQGMRGWSHFSDGKLEAQNTEVLESG